MVVMLVTRCNAGMEILLVFNMLGTLGTPVILNGSQRLYVECMPSTMRLAISLRKRQTWWEHCMHWLKKVDLKVCMKTLKITSRPLETILSNSLPFFSGGKTTSIRLMLTDRSCQEQNLPNEYLSLMCVGYLLIRTSTIGWLSNSWIKRFGSLTAKQGLSPILSRATTNILSITNVLMPFAALHSSWMNWERPLSRDVKKKKRYTHTKEQVMRDTLWLHANFNSLHLLFCACDSMLLLCSMNLLILSVVFDEAWYRH